MSTSTFVLDRVPRIHGGCGSLAELGRLARELAPEGRAAVAHNIGHALASLRPIHHGRAVALAMLASLPWNIQGEDGRFARVASLMGAGETAAALPAAFERLVRAVGIKVALAGEGHDDITPEILARQMARPENAAMRKSNRRTVTDEDLWLLARRLLSQT